LSEVISPMSRGSVIDPIVFPFWFMISNYYLQGVVIQIVTPTSEIYAKIDEVLSIQQIRILPLIVVASTVAIVVLVILLKKWNIILAREVKRRTKELEESYDEMKKYIEQVQAELRKGSPKKGRSTI
jgi:hypothetical protein